jgi:hypothetical protein
VHGLSSNSSIPHPRGLCELRVILHILNLACTHTHTHTHTHKYGNTQIHKYTRMHTYTHTHIHTYTRFRIRTRAHARRLKTTRAADSRCAGAATVFDAYRLAKGREDLLTDGSHYSYHYRRVAASLILDTLCPLSPSPRTQE